jgi:hypothetical protein
VRQLRDATIGLLKAVFYIRSVPRCCRQDKSRVQLVVREWPEIKNVNMEDEEVTALEAVTRRQPVKLQQDDKR